MPKMKTHRGAAKRFKSRGSQIKRRRAFRNHILTKMARKQKRALRKAGVVSAADQPSVKRMLLL